MEDIIKIVRDAGLAILDIYNTNNLGVTIKEDKSPLTKADLISNEIIIKGLRAISDYPIITEESYVEYDDRKNWGDFWLVDPIDGTKDFIAKNGEFTINIALLKECKPVLGIIYAPAIDEIYYAESGKGALLIKNGERFKLPIQKCDEYTIARSRFHDVPELNQFCNINSIFKSKTIGSALKFGRLARGDINMYPRFNGSKEWDIAAGHIIIKEAGCKIVDLVTLAEPVYNKPDIRNNFFIAYSKDIDFNRLNLPRLKI